MPSSHNIFEIVMTRTKILVVEDEQLVADDLRETLEFLGFEVTALAATGEAAIDHVASCQPDLVLMDIRLEGAMDGIEASEKIQSIFKVPVVYLTANADRSTLERVKETHPYGYILKPFNEATLSTTIEIALARHQAESQVRQALAESEENRQQAESEVQTRSDYFSMASHEFRNPLATIQFATDFLQRYSDQLPEDKRQRHLDRIRAATESLNYLLEDVLTLERIGKGFQYSPKLTDVKTLCQELVDAFRFNFGAKYTLKFSARKNCQPAYVDDKLLWHLLNNLLSNAVKYSPDGGVVSLDLGCDPKNLYFQVTDAGIGIPEEAQKRLFQPFQRAGNVQRIPGTGLGLAIVKKCVDLHQGEITVESQVGVGTTFKVRLPRGKVESEELKVKN